MAKPSIGDILQNQGFVLLSFLAAIAVINYPLQKIISLSRFQHYSLALAAVSVGFLLQGVWSWRRFNWWGKLCHGAASLYIGCFAFTVYANPWLDSNVALQTENQMEQRQLLAGIYGLTGLPLGWLWMRWNVEERKRRRLLELSGGSESD